MLKEPSVGKKSFFDRLDPRWRISGALFAICCFALVHAVPAVLCGMALAIFLLLLSSLPLKHIVRRLIVVNIFIVFLWITVLTSLWLSGQSVFNWDNDEIKLCWLITFKCNTVCAIFLSIFSSLSISVFGKALSALHFPDKFVFLFLLTYRYIFVMEEKWNSIQTAAKLRGFKLSMKFQAYKNLAMMLGMVIVASFERSENVYNAMKLRGFSGKIPSLVTFRHTWKDIVFMSALGVFITFALFLNWHPGFFFNVF